MENTEQSPDLEGKMERMEKIEESGYFAEGMADGRYVAPSDVRFNLILNDGSVIDCRAGKEVYESLFGARLEYVPRTIHNLNRGDYVVWEWQETETANLPRGLDKYVAGVELARRLYLTD